MITVAELDERIERCLTILSDNPHSQVFAALAEAYRRRGDFGRAFSVCKNGLKHHPDYAQAHIVMAKLYLHQKMTDEALASVQRAVEIDGPTGTADLLEAEVHLMMRNAALAQVVIDRLRIAQPKNPAIKALTKQLRELRESIRAQEAEREEAGDDTTPSAKHPRQPNPTEVIDWTEWAACTGEVRGVTGVVSFDHGGQTLASHAKEGITHAGLESIQALFNEVDAALRQAGWGSLEEIRIELPNSEVWSGIVNNTVLGLTGNLQGMFGEARRRAVEAAMLVRTTPHDDSDDLTHDGHRDLLPAAPAE